MTADWRLPCGQNRCRFRGEKWTATCRHTSSSGNHPIVCHLHRQTQGGRSELERKYTPHTPLNLDLMLASSLFIRFLSCSFDLPKHKRTIEIQTVVVFESRGVNPIGAPIFPATSALGRTYAHSSVYLRWRPLILAFLHPSSWRLVTLNRVLCRITARD